MPPNVQTLRQTALDLFQAAVRAADPAPALRAELLQTPPTAWPDGRIFVIAIGKAACTMMAETLTHLPAGRRVDALAVTNYENARDIPGCTVMAAGHPVPDANGERASRAVIDLLGEAGAGDLVLALISGGGSALLPAPVAGVSLDDKAKVTDVLLGAGFDITELNMVRQQLSRLKGGGMARLAAPARLQAYILSDVLGDDLRVVASGPTVGPIGSLAAARNLLMARGVLEQMPSSVQAHLRSAATEVPAQPDNVLNTLICSNRQSLEAALGAAKALGWRAHIVSDRLEGDVAAAAALLHEAAARQEKGSKSVLLAGGETTVKLSGKGKGGRNQELALRFALLMTPPSKGTAAGAAKTGAANPCATPCANWVFLSGGTDGRDGPTDAAGGIVDHGSIARMIAAGANPLALLADNDSHAALKVSGDLLTTGATGTNVADIQIFIQEESLID